MISGGNRRLIINQSTQRKGIQQKSKHIIAMATEQTLLCGTKFTHNGKTLYMKLTRDEAGTPISSTTSRTMLSNISRETLMLIESGNSFTFWWDVIPIS